MRHLFISHATSDGAQIASELAAALETANRKCWIAPRDVRAGFPYPGQIIAAIEASLAVIIVVTPGACASADVLQEVQFAHTNKTIIVPVICEGTRPSKDLQYFFGVRQSVAWSTAMETTLKILQMFPSKLEYVGLKGGRTVSIKAVGPNRDAVLALLRLYGFSDGDALALADDCDQNCVEGLSQASADSFVAEMRAVGASAWQYATSYYD